MRYNYNTNSIEWVVQHANYFGRATSLVMFPSGLYVGGALNMQKVNFSDSSNWVPFIL